MSGATDILIKKLADTINSSPAKKVSPYDTQAEVKRVEGDIAWVHIPGGVDETPVQLTTNAKKGDIVQVRVSGGRAWLYGNQTNPPTDDTKANAADARAGKAMSVADQAWEEAESAHEAADAAWSYADNAQQAAENAQTSANNALASAQSAQTSADSALVSLSTVEDVVGVLNWITAHGTMTANGSTALDPSKVYFVRDNSGDYHVGSYYYSIVAEPKTEDRTSYYTLSIDESVQNYVATHVVVDTEGLWLIPDSGGNKVLIATGAGSSYTTAGTYIIGKVNGVDNVFAKFTRSSATIGEESSLEMTTRTFNVRDKENSTFFEVVDMRNDSGVGTVTETWVASGGSVFILSVTAVNTNYTVTVNGAQASPTKSTSSFSFDSAPSSGSTIQATYTSASQLLKQYTSGLRADNSIKGLMSFAEGYNVTASGFCSHAEGRDTVARGLYSHAEGREAKAYNLNSHAEGYNTQANGPYSHAEGYGTQANGNMSHAQGQNTSAIGTISHASGNGTTAGYSTQTVIGAYNSNQSGNVFEIGNGSGENQRSNAFEVSWGGSVNIASGAKYKINGTNLAASDVSALPISGGTMTSNGQIINGHITNSSTRETTPNLTPTGKRGITALLASSAMTTARPGEGTIIHCEWDNNGGWNSQLFIADNDSGNGKPFVAVRGQRSGTWTDWDKLLSESTVKDYVIAQSQSTTSYGDGYWRWREWNSGKVEIWYHGSLTLTTADSDFGGVKRYSRWFNLPNSYSLYRCTCMVNGMQEGAWYGCGGTRDSSNTVGAEPVRSMQVMGYRIASAPPSTPINLNIYICGQKTI